MTDHDEETAAEWLAEAHAAQDEGVKAFTANRDIMLAAVATCELLPSNAVSDCILAAVNFALLAGNVAACEEALAEKRKIDVDAGNAGK